jgi:3-phenylpropionate/trans-cinnamate dioxygenase ferredoxin reductase subunit
LARRMSEEFIIVGGSYAACEIASAARENGYDANIRIFTDEGELPYHRPPLSKAFLLGTADEGGLPVKGEKFYRDRNIDVAFHARVAAIDPRAGSMTLADGRTVKFDQLALAVGARARTLSVPGSDLAGVFYLRSIADARALKRAAEQASDVVVIGGGFIGLEVAAALAQRSKKVTVLEAQEHLLNRVVAPAISKFLADAHRAQGVEIMTKAKVVEIKGDNGRVRQVVLHCESVLPADLVIVGIGSEPNTELAAAAGLACRDGIVVDQHARTSHPRILAAGDCAFYAGPYTNGGMRLESVQNALDQSRCAGASVAGIAKRYDAIPWFWSDQYKLKLQIAGISQSFDSYVERPGGPDEMSVLYFRDEFCIAVDSINRPREHMSARRLLPKGLVTKGKLAEVEFDIAALMTAGVSPSKPHPGSSQDARPAPDSKASSLPARSSA